MRRLAALLAANPGASLVVDVDTAAAVADLPEHVVVEPGDRLRFGAATVDVEVAADSPLADSLLPLLDDPSLLAQTPGTVVVEVQGRKALRRLAPAERTAEVSLVLPPRTLVVVRALRVQGDTEALAYAAALDLAAVERLLGP